MESPSKSSSFCLSSSWVWAKDALNLCRSARLSQVAMLDSSSDFLFLSSAMSWTISALADTFSCPDEPDGANMELENSVGPPMDELPPGIPPKVLLFPSESSTSMFVWLVFHAMVYSLKHHPQTSTHTWAKGDLRVDGLCKKLCDDLFWFSLMHKQCSLLSLFLALYL